MAKEEEEITTPMLVCLNWNHQKSTQINYQNKKLVYCRQNEETTFCSSSLYTKSSTFEHIQLEKKSTRAEKHSFINISGLIHKESDDAIHAIHFVI